MSVHIVDDEQRRDRPQFPCALRVPAARGHLRRWRSLHTTEGMLVARALPAGLRAAAKCKRYSLTGPNSRLPDGTWRFSWERSGRRLAAGAHFQTDRATWSVLARSCSLAPNCTRRSPYAKYEHV